MKELIKGRGEGNDKRGNRESKRNEPVSHYR